MVNQDIVQRLLASIEGFVSDLRQAHVDQHTVLVAIEGKFQQGAGRDYCQLRQLFLFLRPGRKQRLDFVKKKYLNALFDGLAKSIFTFN